MFKAEFALRLKRWRKQRGLTQSQASRVLGVESVRTLQNWESGRTRPIPILARVIVKRMAERE
jgi:transcriptional regulator with XRE-family HTH domain